MGVDSDVSFMGVDGTVSFMGVGSKINISVPIRDQPLCFVLFSTTNFEEDAEGY